MRKQYILGSQASDYNLLRKRYKSKSSNIIKNIGTKFLQKQGDYNEKSRTIYIEYKVGREYRRFFVTVIQIVFSLKF